MKPTDKGDLGVSSDYRDCKRKIEDPNYLSNLRYYITTHMNVNWKRYYYILHHK